MLSNSTECYREFFIRGRVNRYSTLHCFLILRNCQWQGGINWEMGIDVYTLLYLKYITDKNLLYSTLLVSSVQQSESVIQICVSTSFQILLPYRSLQSTL